LIPLSTSSLFIHTYLYLYDLHSFPTRRSSDLTISISGDFSKACASDDIRETVNYFDVSRRVVEFCRTESFKLIEKLAHELAALRSEEHTSELQSLRHLVCRLLLEKKKLRYFTF